MGWFGKSAEERAAELQEIHNQGQTDASNGKREEPHGFWEQLIGGDAKSQIEDNQAYEKGQQNGRK